MPIGQAIKWQENEVFVSGGGAEAEEPILCMYMAWLADNPTYLGVVVKNKDSGFASPFLGFVPRFNG